MPNTLSLLRLPAALEATGERRSTFYNRIKSGEMPPPVKIGERAAAWPAHEIQVVVSALIAGSSKADIRALVSRLIAERASLRPDTPNETARSAKQEAA